MSDPTLRSRLIRLAHAKPELRPHLLPMLKEASYVPRTYEELHELSTGMAALAPRILRGWTLTGLGENAGREGRISRVKVEPWKLNNVGAYFYYIWLWDQDGNNFRTVLSVKDNLQGVFQIRWSDQFIGAATADVYFTKTAEPKKAWDLLRSSQRKQDHWALKLLESRHVELWKPE